MSEPDDQASREPVILAGDGRPARRLAEADRRCPRCGASADKRVASCGFGTPHPLCSVCGYEWVSEVWRA